MKIKRPIGKWLAILGRFQQMYLARGLEPMGIGFGQYSLLMAVCDSPGIQQDDIAQQLFLNKSSVARGLSTLEENGFLYREINSKDKRAYNVYPTQKGLEILEDIFKLCNDATEKVTGPLSEEELDILNELLRRMSEYVLEDKGK